MGIGASSVLPLSEKIQLAVSCDVWDSQIRVYRFQGTREELETGVKWSGETGLEGMANDAAMGAIIAVRSIELVLGDGMGSYTLDKEGIEKALNLFVQKKKEAVNQAKEASKGFQLIGGNLIIGTKGAHENVKIAIRAMIKKNRQFQMLHWSPISCLASKSHQMVNDDNIYKASTREMVGFMLAYVTDYAPVYGRVDTEDAEAMLRMYSDHIKKGKDEFKDVSLYDRNGTLIYSVADESSEEADAHREFVVAVLRNFIELAPGMEAKFIAYLHNK